MIAKRAVTRPCPVCKEQIPVRLLGTHAELEMSRVEDILKGSGPYAASMDFDLEYVSEVSTRPFLMTF